MLDAHHFCAHLVDDFLRIGDAGSALGLATKRAVGFLGAWSAAAAGDLPEFVLADSVADANDHESIL